MSFESFEAPKIVPDVEQAEVWKKVREYFEANLEGEEESSMGGSEETAVRLNEVLEAIEEQDYSKAYEFLEREIFLMKQHYELAQDNALANKVDMPKSLEEEIARLEALRDSLNLEEK